MRQYTLLPALFVVGLLAGAANAQEKLAWKFKEGDKFYLEEKTLVKQTIKVLGNTEEKEEAQTNVVSFLVQKKTADSVVLVQTIEELTTDVKKGNADPMAQQILDKMRGHQFTITLNHQGQITKFEGYEKLIDKLSNDDAKVAKVLGAVLPIDFFKKTSEQIFAMLPDQAVGVGDTWKRETALSMGPLGGFKAVQRYKYEGAEKGLAVISHTAQLDYVTPKGDAAGLPFKITKGNLKAENAKGRMLFDNTLGRPSQDSASTAIRGALTMEILNMEVEVEVNLAQTSVLRVSATKPGTK